jgi:nicotinic acid mononucleotide adenylyltransferase
MESKDFRDTLVRGLVEAIKEMGIPGVIVEAGAGVPVAQALYSRPGISSIVYQTLSPYSKHAQEALFGKNISQTRAVSMEHVRDGLLSLIKQYDPIEGVDFLYNSSAQITDDFSSTHITHGWFGIARRVIDHAERNWTIDLVHSSLHMKDMVFRSRTDLIEELGFTGLIFLKQMLCGEGIPVNRNIDIIDKYLAPYAGATCRRNLTDSTIVIKEAIDAMGDEGYLAIVGGELVRIDDIFGDKDVSVYKGSFAPPTNAHVHFVSDYEALKKLPTGSVAFMISMDTFDKGSQQAYSVAWRARLINEIGYPVIINRNGFFYDNASFLKKKFAKTVSFLLGSDTINRVIDWSKKNKGTGWKFSNDHEFDNVMFYVCNRTNVPVLPEALDARVKIISDGAEISSTMIRTFRAEGKLDEIRKVMPASIVEHYLNIPI